MGLAVLTELPTSFGNDPSNSLASSEQTASFLEDPADSRTAVMASAWSRSKKAISIIESRA